jgi:hypothetical protein
MATWDRLRLIVAFVARNMVEDQQKMEIGWRYVTSKEEACLI